LNFAFMRELSTPRCLPKLKSRVVNKSRIQPRGSSYTLYRRSVLAALTNRLDAPSGPSLFRRFE
jgi:hypothetical protein